MKRLLCVMIAVLLLSVGCGRTVVSDRTTLRLALDGDPVQLDAQAADDKPAVTVLSAVMEGLTKFDEDGLAVPGAAESWTISPDGLVYLFSLRQNAVWRVPSGLMKSKEEETLPVTADDFVFAFSRAMQSDIGPISRETQNIASVKASGRYKLTVTLKQQDDRFLQRLAQSVFFPCCEELFSRSAGRYGLEAEYTPANGPFYVKSWTHGKSVSLRKYEQYYDASSILPHTVNYTIGTVTNPVDRLKSGALSVAVLNEPADGLQTVSLQDTVRAVWLNCSVKALSHLSVRSALRDGIDYALTEQILSGEAPAKGLLPPLSVLSGNEYYRNASNARVMHGQTEQARERLRAGLNALSLAECPQLTVLCENDPSAVQLGETIVQCWQKHLGVYFRLEAVDAARLRERVKSGQYQIALMAAQPSSPFADNVLEAFASADGNYCRFQHADYTALWEQSAPNGLTRSEADALEVSLLAQCPFIPLTFPTRYIGLTPGLNGLIVRPFGGGSLGTDWDFRFADILR